MKLSEKQYPGNQRQQQAEAILLRYLAAWQTADPVERLAACACCKLDGIAWQQDWFNPADNEPGPGATPR